MINEVIEKLNEEKLENVSGGASPAEFLAGLGMVFQILDVAHDVGHLVQAVKWAYRRY